MFSHLTTSCSVGEGVCLFTSSHLPVFFLFGWLLNPHRRLHCSDHVPMLVSELEFAVLTSPFSHRTQHGVSFVFCARHWSFPSGPRHVCRTRTSFPHGQSPAECPCPCRRISVIRVDRCVSRDRFVPGLVFPWGWIPHFLAPMASVFDSFLVQVELPSVLLEMVRGRSGILRRRVWKAVWPGI